MDMNTSQQLQTSFSTKSPAAILASLKINSRPRIAVAPKLKDFESDENDFLQLGTPSLSARGESTQNLLYHFAGITPVHRNQDEPMSTMKPLDLDLKKSILKPKKDKIHSLPTLQFLEDNYQFGNQQGLAESRVEINDTCMQMDGDADSRELESMAMIGDSMMKPKKSKKVTFAVEVDLQQDIDITPRAKTIKRPKLKILKKLKALNEVSDKVLAESADLPVYDRSRPMILLNYEPRSADVPKLSSLSNIMSKPSYKPNPQPNDRYKEMSVVKSLLTPIEPNEAMKSMSKNNFVRGTVTTPDSSFMNRQSFNIKLPSIPTLSSTKMFESSIIASVPNSDRKHQRSSILKEDIQRSKAAQTIDSDRSYLRSSIQREDSQRPKEIHSLSSPKKTLRSSIQREELQRSSIQREDFQSSSIQREDILRSKELVAPSSARKNTRPSMLMEENGYVKDFQIKSARNLTSSQNLIHSNFQHAKPSYPNLDKASSKRSQDTTLDTENKISPNIESPMGSRINFDTNQPFSDPDIEVKQQSFFLFKKQRPSQVSKLNL